MRNAPLWVDIPGTEVAETDIPVLQHPRTGGVLLFTKNYENKKQLRNLVEQIRHKAEQEILIAVDHEGGRVWRFEQEFFRPSAMGEFGKIYDQDKSKALSEITKTAAKIAAELKSCDIDMTFAPVLDLDHGVSDVIGNRAFHRDPHAVTECAGAYIKGLREQGMGAVGKHFPGHGGCSMDSHFITAADTRTYAQLDQDDLIPFKELHAQLDFIMPAHVLYPEVDQQIPALSKIWLQDILRNKIGYKGKIVSDCLSMKGSGYDTNIKQGAKLALQAGCDMIIATQQIRQYDIIEVLDYL